MGATARALAFSECLMNKKILGADIYMLRFTNIKSHLNKLINYLLPIFKHNSLWLYIY